MRLAVHPHARGDDRRSRIDLRHRFTPTRVGTTASLRRQASDRFTPTRVGTTSSARSSGHAATGSPPRAWGRRRNAAITAALCCGSPPRAWGRLASQSAACTAHSSRFTPTRVGTTRDRRAGHAPTAVHPHARGDDDAGRHDCGVLPVHPHARGDDDVDASRRASTGSPPRAWGRRRRSPLGSRSGSPPRAWGRRLTAVGIRATRGSPPRAWGRRLQLAARWALIAGSPPRAWGRLRQHEPHRGRLRFTPTRVGTTSPQ